MTKKDIHVAPHKDGWAVKKEGGERASSVHSRKEDAMQPAREQSRRHKVEVVEHGGTGRVRAATAMATIESVQEHQAVTACNNAFVFSGCTRRTRVANKTGDLVWC